MASFDLINIVGQAYKKTWEERRYLLRMATLPFLVKLACFTVLTTFIEDESMWLTAITLLPAFLIEGWLLAHWVRTIMTDGAHRWPFKFSSNEKKDMAELSVRGRGVMGGLVAYALINFLIAGYFAALFSGMDLSEGIDPENPDPRIAGIGFVFMVTSLVTFRFIWLYIPLSINLPLGEAIKKLQPMRLTFKMVGVWLVCVIPAFLALQILTQMAFSVSEDGEGNAIIQMLSLVFRIIIDMAKNLIVTAGMAYVFIALFKK